MNSTGSRGVLRTKVRRLHSNLKEDATDHGYIVAAPGIGYRTGNSDSPSQPPTAS